MESFESFDVAVVRRSHLAGALLALPLLAGAALLVYGVHGAYGAIAAAAALVMWGGYGVFTLRDSHAWRRIERVAHLRADARGVYFDGDLALDRGSITRAYLQPRKGEAPLVVLETKRGALEVTVGEDARAYALLSAIGFDASRSSLNFGRVFMERERGGGDPLAWMGPTALLVGGSASGFAVLDGDAPLVIPIVAFATMLAVLGHLRAADVTIGADGVSYTRFGRTTFVSLASIEGVEPVPRGAVLSLTNGSRLAFRFAPSRHAGRETPEADALVARLTHLHAAKRRGKRAPLAAEILARGSRASHAWLRDLRTLGRDGRAAYRGAIVPLEQLWAVLEDPTAGSSARAGAAVALGDALDDVGRERIRIVTEGCASPKLRVAFDVVSIASVHGCASPRDDDAIARALDECDDDALAVNADGSPSPGARRSRS